MNGDFEIVGDDAREARIVAVVLGEASDFECEEVKRLCEEEPELKIFRRRIEALHGLMGEPVESSEDGQADWKLSDQKRQKVLAILAEEEADTDTVVVTLSPRKRKWKSTYWQPIAALLAVSATAFYVTRVTLFDSAKSVQAEAPSRLSERFSSLGKQVKGRKEDQS